MQRVEREMVPYLLNVPDHFYSALTVEVRPPLDDGTTEVIPFEPSAPTFPGGITFGTILLDGTQQLYALDGQHRLQSIKRAVRQNAALAREQIAVILIPFRSLRRSQTLFSDLNRYAKAPSKSVSLLFSHRDPVVAIAKRLANEVDFLRGRVEMESTSLSKHTPNAITLSSLYEMTRQLLYGRTPEGEAEIERELEVLLRIWARLVDVIPQWGLVAERVEHPAYLRPKFLCMHGVGQQAIGGAAAAVLRDHAGDLDALDRFKEVDWTISNPDWQAVAVQGRRINNTSTSVRNLAALLAFKLGSAPSPREAVALCEIMRARGDVPSDALAARAMENEVVAV